MFLCTVVDCMFVYVENWINCSLFAVHYGSKVMLGDECNSMIGLLQGLMV